MTDGDWRWGWVALMATTACGGDLLGVSDDAGSEVPVVAVADAAPPVDAALADASSADVVTPREAGPVCGGESWAQVFASFKRDDGDSWVGDVEGVLEFVRRVDFLDYERNLVVQYQFVDPATGMTCTDVATCTYDPTLPRVSPQDVSHSDAWHRFTGPNGRSCVWAYDEPSNTWFLVDGGRNPQAYQLLVEFNAGCSPNCPCDAG